MSPILTMQRQMRELGRIRTGVQVLSKGKTGTRPAKLETFRLTSDKRELIDAAAEIYRGEVRPWQSPTGPQWEVISESDTLDMIVPPGDPIDQWFEMWNGGGCVRRCTGITNVLDMTPCACPQNVEERLELAADGRACKATTRLWVMLPNLPDVGRWRLESHGYYAAVELGGAAVILARATQTGLYIPAQLRLQQRERKRPGRPTLKYAVPIIEATAIRAEMFNLVDPTFGKLGEGTPAALTSGQAQRQLNPGRPVRPVAGLPASSDSRAPAPQPKEDRRQEAPGASEGDSRAAVPAVATVPVEPEVEELTPLPPAPETAPDEASQSPLGAPAVNAIPTAGAASLIERLIAAADEPEALGQHGTMTQAQRAALGPLLAHLGPDRARSDAAIAVVMAQAFDYAGDEAENGAVSFGRTPSRYVHALLKVADDLTPAVFRAQWQAIAEAAQP